MSDLRRKKQALEQELQRIAQEMRKVKRKHATCGHLHITAGQRTTARALMVMRDGEPTAAMTFLRSKYKGPAPIATQWADMESELREWWISADENTKTKHRNISDANQNMHNAIKAAQRFIVDDDLEAWVAHQNVSKGINPAPALTLQEARVVKERMGVQAPPTHRGARQWLQRWRRRRRLRLWRLHPGGLWMEGGYMARPARRRTRKIKPWLPCFKVSASGSAKIGVQFSASVLRPRLQRQV